MRWRSPLLGREPDLDRLESALAESRLIQLLGPPGVGKSKLVEHLAGRPGASALSVERAEDAEALVARLAQHLDAKQHFASTAAAAPELAKLLRRQGVALLLLDHAESLAPAREIIEGLLEAHPELRIVVASRRALEYSWDARVELAPIAEESDAIDLLLAHAARRRPELADPSPATRGTLGAIVRELDALPLALVLAAGHLAVLGPEELLSLLREDRFRTLRGDAAHAGLRAAIAASWERLAPREQAVFAQVATFEGGFTLEAASAVATADRFEVLASLRTLVDRSLVEPEEAGRFFLHAYLREFAEERALELGLAEEARRAHAAYYAARAQESRASQGSFRGPLDPFVRREERNLRAVVARAPAVALEHALRCWLELADLDASTGNTARTRDELERLDPDLEALPWELRAAIGLASARLRSRHDIEGVRRDMVSLADAAMRAGDLRTAGEADRWASVVTLHDGHADEALTFARRAVERLDESGAELAAGHARTQLGRVLLGTGDLEEARSHYRDALRIVRRGGATRLQPLIAMDLATVALELGDHAGAETARAEASERFADLGMPLFVEFLGGLRAMILHDRGELDEAERAYRDAIDALARLGDTPSQLGDTPSHAGFTGQLGLLRWERGELSEARRLAKEAAELFAHASYGAHAEVMWDAVATIRAEMGDLDLEEDAPIDEEADAMGAVRRLLRLHRDHLRGLPFDAARHAPLRLDRSYRLRLFARPLLGHLRADAQGGPLLRFLTPPEISEVRVHVGRGWVALPEGEPIQLGRYPVLRRTVEVLVEAHAADPNQALDVAQMLQRVWPDEKLRVRTARSRVYVAISRLRKMGLDTILDDDESGYRLRPNLRVLSVDD